MFVGLDGRQALLLWEARDYGATTWSPACHEQLSWRFHWWRHSHSVPVRWRRGVARAAAVVEQAVRAAHPEPQATQAAREAVRAATALLNRPAAKAVRLAILLLNRPAVRAKIALIPQGRELGLVLRRGACADAEPTARLGVSSVACRALIPRRASPVDRYGYQLSPVANWRAFVWAVRLQPSLRRPVDAAGLSANLLGVARTSLRDVPGLASPPSPLRRMPVG